MQRSFRIQLALGILSVSFQVDARPAENPAQPVNIRLYDLANISPYTLDAATREAARVLATAGVEVVWQRGPADSPEAHTTDQTAGATVGRQTLDTRGYLVVRIIRDFPARALPGWLGYAFPDATSGVHATVFYDRIERISQSGVISVPALLGNALAHEIGHVLLGTTEHTPDGIMKARWGRAEFQSAAMGFLGFTQSQRAAIRDRLLTWLAGK